MRKIVIGVAVIGVLLLLSNMLLNRGVGTPPPVPGENSGTQTIIKTQKNQTPAPETTPVDPKNLDLRSKPIILLNPATAKPGSSIGVTGSGFDPGSTVTFVLKRKKDDKGQDLGFVQADKGGNISGFNFTLPQETAGGSFIVEATSDGAVKQATATGNAVANSPEVKFGTQVGKPGDTVAISAKGFSPKETISVYFNSLSSEPIGTIQADDGGGIQQAALEIPFGAVGNNNFIFMGDKSQSPVTVPFLMLNLYPVIDLSSYASKADNPITFSGDGFGPNEKVAIHLNDVDSPPIAVAQADEKGAFTGQGSFNIPYELKGKNTLIAIGEQSQAPTTVSFDVLPYTPNAEASTYGGKPGTTVTFYGADFGRNEIVRVYVGRSEQSQGQEVTCGKTDDQGNLLSAGSYQIPGDAQAGTLEFTLVGDKTQAAAKASMEVMAAGGNVPVPPANNQPYVCQYDEEARQQAEAQATQTAQAQAPQPTPTPEGAQPSETPGAQPQPSETPGAQPQAPSSTVVVGNTEGEGVSVRQDPGTGDKLAVWPDGTRLELTGDSEEVDGETWVKIKDPAGNEGWVPNKFVSPVQQ